jgi:hypothetical protein
MSQERSLYIINSAAHTVFLSRRVLLPLGYRYLGRHDAIHACPGP